MRRLNMQVMPTHSPGRNSTSTYQPQGKNISSVPVYPTGFSSHIRKISDSWRRHNVEHALLKPTEKHVGVIVTAEVSAIKVDHHPSLIEMKAPEMRRIVQLIRETLVGDHWPLILGEFPLDLEIEHCRILLIGFNGNT